MSTTGRKWDAIDRVKMYAQLTEKDLVDLVRKKRDEGNVVWFEKTIYGIQAGMADAASNKLNTEELCTWYCWLLRFLEKAEKSIFASLNQNPNWNPATKSDDKKIITDKRALQVELEKYRRAKSF